MINIGIDFDGTLSETEVQDYVKTLTNLPNLKVHIITRRYEKIDMYSDEELEAWGIGNIELEHNYLFEVAELVGIDNKNIIFCNMDYKYKKIKENNIQLHLDNDLIDLMHIWYDNTINCEGIRYHPKEILWKERINKFLNENNII